MIRILNPAVLLLCSISELRSVPSLDFHVTCFDFFPFWRFPSPAVSDWSILQILSMSGNSLWATLQNYFCVWAEDLEKLFCKDEGKLIFLFLLTFFLTFIPQESQKKSILRLFTINLRVFSAFLTIFLSELAHLIFDVCNFSKSMMLCK